MAEPNEQEAVAVRRSELDDVESIQFLAEENPLSGVFKDTNSITSLIERSFLSITAVSMSDSSVVGFAAFEDSLPHWLGVSIDDWFKELRLSQPSLSLFKVRHVSLFISYYYYFLIKSFLPILGCFS